MLNDQRQEGSQNAAQPNEAGADKSQLSAPTLSLPKGGGAIRGIGEKFAANPVTGTGSMTVPIATSPGRAGFGPQLSLAYDSGAGNGPFGFGWNLSLPAITRKTDKGLPQYRDAEESDVFILSGAEDLAPVLVEANGAWQRETLPLRTLDGVTYRIQHYRPRIEGLFARIERWTNSKTGETHWRSITRDNITTLYGKTAESRIADPADPTHVFSWLICESYDDKGNAMVYQYKAENSDRVDLSQAHEQNRTPAGRSTNRYLKRIKYGNRVSRLVQPDLAQAEWLFEVVFDYGEHDPDDPKPKEATEWLCRHDPFSSYRSGFEVRSYRLCQRVLMFHHFPNEEGVGQGCLVRSTDFVYRNLRHNPDDLKQGHPIASFIAAVTHSGYNRRAEGGYLKRSLPPLEFEYSQVPDPEQLARQPIQEVDPESLENLPYGLDGAHYQWLDLDGEGISGILTEQAGAWFYKRNLSPITGQRDNGHETTVAGFAPVELVAPQPSLANVSAGQQQFLDLAGDGQTDLVQFSRPVSGYYERTQDGNWSPFVPFESAPTLAWDDPNLKFVDLTGDGHADILVTEDQLFTWYPSLAEAGFGPAEQAPQALDEEKGPRLVFADGSQSIYLADMSGDGLTDLMRLRNGEVCYWPNLGYGRFGAKVTMDDAPWFDSPDQFEQRRILLADIDGSGVTDIIYLGRDGVHLYFNQSGNRWSEVTRLGDFPQIDNLSAVLATDLLGNGTACLVWSSPLPGHSRRAMRYLDLMGGQKPHLLISVRNNLGAETRVQYAPSTKFYLADKAAGQPWITRLPFPVHVVERVEVFDHISRNRFVTCSAYHHGYFDGAEREFRGFGLVEQFDTEEFAALSPDGALPEATNLEAASHVPPVLTRTWFHTGAFVEGGRISRQFEEEYYREADLSAGLLGLTDEQQRAMLLDDTMLPQTIRRADGTRVPFDLSAEEMRQACRALKGSILRQEIYGLDGSEEADRPYSVSERNYSLELLQPQGPNRHAVFLTHPRETVDFHYERKLYDVGGQKLADPRVSHALTLAVDDFGNVLQAVAIGYGRRHDDPLLGDDDRKQQKRILLTLTENQYTQPIQENDIYRAPLLCESRTFELLKVLPASKQSGVTNLFRFEELHSRVQEAGDGGHDLPYEDVEAAGATQNQPYRRLIEHVRTLYRRDDLSGPLPLGQLQALALPFESYKLALTPGLLGQVYRRGPENLVPTPATMLGGQSGDQGGYVDLDGNGQGWIPSGRAFYDPKANISTPGATAAQELAEARRHFFLPRKIADPFGHSTTLDYDPYDLLPVRTEDALSNRVQALNDYCVLQPRRLTDLNGNRAEVIFDALGMVVGAAVMGKTTEKLGDSLAGFIADLTPTQIAAFFEAGDPHAPAPALLGQATTRIIYDLDRFKSTGQPSFAATLARETHASEPLPPDGLKVQISFSYSDGFGREIQKKIQAEPGPLIEGGPEVSPRWVGSGWTIFNNKGKPVRQYEPFFSAGHGFEFARHAGVSPVLFYDPAGRVVATLHPNHTWEKVIFDPWRQETWDVNDTVLLDPETDEDVKGFFLRLPDIEYLPTWHGLRTDPAHAAEAAKKWPDPTVRAAEASAAGKAAAHAGTPTVAHFDTLGRPFLTLAHNGFNPDRTPIYFATRVRLDIEGNQREVIDAKDRIVMRYDYDMLGSRIHQASMEAGERWLLNDVTGKPIRSWNSRGHTFRTEYDALRRPMHIFVTGADANNPARELLVQRTVYGETQPNPEANNLRGKVFQLFDSAGVATSDSYDFKGNLRRSRRQLVSDYKTTPDWSGSPALEREIFVSSSAYDALNRPIQLVAPHSGSGASLKTDVIQPCFNEANLLERVDVWLKHAGEPAQLLDPGTADLHAVEDIDYNAKGQRERIAYGNGALTTYDYDPLTFRLIHLKTTRPANPDAIASQLFQNASVVQDLRYTYDPTGNLTRIEDSALKTIHNGQPVEPVSSYIYDAIYRLIEATGREHSGQTAHDFDPPGGNRRDYPFVGHRAHPNNPQALRNYTERYDYDEVGNFQLMRHSADGGSWTQKYNYEEASLIEPGQRSNRLTRTTVGNGFNHLETYTYTDTLGDDGQGCMTAINNIKLAWDFEDQLQQVDLGGGGTAYYVYDAGGQRVRKVIQRQNGARQAERLYLGGFEVYREYNGNGQTVTLEHETLHLMDDQQRIALIETQTIKDSSFILHPSSLTRFQLGNHLGSASVELDKDGALISYEEYHPYGTTALQAMSAAEVSLKRYRYTGKERDEESGLYYHGARYYAPWLGRWTSCDPAGTVDSTNLYMYVKNNPGKFIDPDGRKIEFAPDSSEAFKERFRSTYEYLKKLGASKELDYLESLDYIITIEETFDAEEIGWDRFTGTIYWSTNIGVKTNTGHYLSPALSLAHEASHAERFWSAMQAMEAGDRGEAFEKLRKDRNTIIEDYDNLEEKRVITGPEQDVALKLGLVGKGEKIRTNHIVEEIQIYYTLGPNTVVASGLQYSKSMVRELQSLDRQFKTLISELHKLVKTYHLEDKLEIEREIIQEKIEREKKLEKVQKSGEKKETLQKSNHETSRPQSIPQHTGH
ncbi:MAG: toxin [Anaerolineae bacterium]|nr:toxin [Anaerolineae bacterium]